MYVYICIYIDIDMYIYICIGVYVYIDVDRHIWGAARVIFPVSFVLPSIGGEFSLLFSALCLSIDSYVCSILFIHRSIFLPPGPL